MWVCVCVLALQAHTSKEFSVLYYKKDNAIGFRRKGGDKTQCMSFRSKTCTEKKMREIGDEVRSRWGIEDFGILHRIGRLEIGEISVLIAVSSPHRSEAFAACQYTIDRLKRIVPIWKKEVGEDGESWVEGPKAAHSSN